MCRCVVLVYRAPLTDPPPDAAAGNEATADTGVTVTDMDVEPGRAVHVADVGASAAVAAAAAAAPGEEAGQVGEEEHKEDAGRTAPAVFTAAFQADEPHVVVAHGLAPGTKYTFSVAVDTGSGASVLQQGTGSFSTFPDEVFELNIAAGACDKVKKRGATNMWCVLLRWPVSLGRPCHPVCLSPTGSLSSGKSCTRSTVTTLLT